MYIVMELQLNQDRTFGNLVWAYEDILDAEAKYHTVLAAAAKSNKIVHGAVILDERGNKLMNKAYDHPAQEVEEEQE